MGREAVTFSHIKPPTWPLIAALSAIVISPLLVLATAQGALYNLWPAAMMFGLWAVQRLTKREVGIAVGDFTSYFIALIYPVAIIGCVVLGACLAHLIDLKDFAAATVFRRLSSNLVVTFLLALITEEGFFRGALWGSCERAGFSPAKTVIWTSVAFGLWHFAVPIIDPDFAQPLAKVPQYVIGSSVFGVAMGLLRLRSGSIIVTSASHAIWNASVYTFFGAGEKIGQLGIGDPAIWDPERGYAGLVLAVVAAALLWWWVRPSTARALPSLV